MKKFVKKRGDQRRDCSTCFTTVGERLDCENKEEEEEAVCKDMWHI